jgi:outer membrane protein TolC
VPTRFVAHPVNQLQKRNDVMKHRLLRSLANPAAALVIVCSIAVVFSSAAADLEEAVLTAQRIDPWLSGSAQRESALRLQHISAGTLPDPVVSIGLANLPTDTFEFNQEQMTQAVFGVSQLLPRGDSLNLAQRKLDQLGDQQPLERANRRALVRRQVSLLWLAAYRARQSIVRIENDRALFDYLVDVTRSRYSSALGRVQQQDLVRAQLELTRLEDRLQRLRMDEDAALAGLAEWMMTDFGSSMDIRGTEAVPAASPAAPAVQLLVPDITSLEGTELQALLSVRLQRHPTVLSLDQQIGASDTDIAIAQQQYKPQWRINASYGYRDESPAGVERSDFFSVGLAFDIPLFTSTRQDPEVKAAEASAGAIRTERSLLLRRLFTAVRDQVARLQWLEQRQALYTGRLLAQMHEQAEASLAAYTSDEEDFAEVVRARIDELNAQIDALNLEVDRLATIVELNYYLTVIEPGEVQS